MLQQKAVLYTAECEPEKMQIGTRQLVAGT